MMEAMKVRKRVREYPFYREQAKKSILRFKCFFCEKTTKITLKNGLDIDLGIILFVYLRDVM